MLKELKKRLSLTRSLILVTLFLAASTGLGQSSRGEVITDIPFPFVVANRTLPPGRYTVTPIGEKNFRIYATKKQGVVFQIHGMQRSTPEGVTKVVFHRYGDTYFLSELWVAGNDIGSQLFPSAAETEMGKRSDKEIAVLVGIVGR